MTALVLKVCQALLIHRVTRVAGQREGQALPGHASEAGVAGTEGAGAAQVRVRRHCK